MSGIHLADLIDREIEHRHQRGALGGERDHFVVLKIKTRPDARRIARHEGIPVANQAGERVAAIPILRGAGDDARHIEILADLP